MMATVDLEPQEVAVTPTSVAITIQLAVLAVAFVIGRALERIRFQWMGEAGAALLLGLVVGLILKAAGVGSRLAAAVAFKGGIFFYILLPTIMFDAGYSLDTRMFIKNVGSLCLYAFGGTTISCFVVGLMMWAFGVWGWCHSMPLLANLTFGALISATDPVTVLAVFQRLNAQPDLYMNVFGESVLNDAVGMVLYNVIASFLDGKDVNAGSVFAGIGLFVGIFLGSTAIGIAIGLLAALIFRSRYFYTGPVALNGSDPGSTGPKEVTSGSNSTFEVGLAVVFAYGSYLVADAARCSGIVAVVVNGMVMNMYVRPNLSLEAAHKIETLFKTLAGLFELFVFCYIGTTMFLQDEEFKIVGYTALSLVALGVSRAANILPCTALVNVLRPVERHIPPAQQFMLWWSGLRGAMAFALSVEADERFGEYGKVMKTCTFYLIFITVLFNGGTSAYLLKRLRLRAEDTPALILNLHDTLAHMHGFGSQDAVEGAAGGRENGSSRATGQDSGPKGRKCEDDKEEVPERGYAMVGGSESEIATVGGASGGAGGGKGRQWSLRNAEADDEEEEEGYHLIELHGAAAAGLPDDRSDSGGKGRVSLREGSRTSSRGGRGFRAFASRSLVSTSSLLERVRSLNDGRLVDRFDEFDRRMSQVLIHPDALREVEFNNQTSFRAGLAANQHGGLGAVGTVHGSHEQPQTLTPLLSPSPSNANIALTLTEGGTAEATGSGGQQAAGAVGAAAQSSFSKVSITALQGTISDASGRASASCGLVHVSATAPATTATDLPTLGIAVPLASDASNPGRAGGLSIVASLESIKLKSLGRAAILESA